MAKLIKSDNELLEMLYYRREKELSSLIWIMSEDQLHRIRDRPYDFRDGDDKPMHIEPGPGVSGYGTLLGLKIAIVDFGKTHISLAKI